ncbi:MAG: xylose isomerase [Candidatus Hydromicrobium americanum]|nr:MAG: xylose isomerase [Candidatus Hydromicrobium americanum]
MKVLNTNYQSKRRSRQELIEHLNSFNLDIKISVGIWYFTPVGGRFHEAYVDNKDIPQRLEMAADMAKYGVKAIEAHYPLEVNEDNYHLYKKLEQETGIRLLSCYPSIFYSREYEFGSLSNPYDKYRDKAIEILINCLKFVKDKGLHHASIWPGIDGYLYSLGTNYYDMWDRFENAVAYAMDEVPGVPVAIEPKPYEPAPNNIYRTTADGLLACHDIESRLKSEINKDLLKKGYRLLGMQPEIGHIRMGFEDAPYAFSRVTREGRLFHTHWNSQPMGNYDQDLNVGVVEWQQAEASLFSLKMVGYNEYFGIDINPERMPVQKAIEINSTALNIMNERISNLPNEEIVEAYFTPEDHRGDIELILAKRMK